MQAVIMKAVVSPVPQNLVVGKTSIPGSDVPAEVGFMHRISRGHLYKDKYCQISTWSLQLILQFSFHLAKEYPANIMRFMLALSSVLMAVHHATSSKLGLRFDKRQSALPTLTLPYATYRAANYNPNGDVGLSKPKLGQC